MSDEQSNFNLLSDSDTSKVFDGSWQNATFDVKEPEFGAPYTLTVTYDSSADGLWFQARFNYLTTNRGYKRLSDTLSVNCAKGKHSATVTIPSFNKPDDFKSAEFFIMATDISGKGTIKISRPMLVEGTEPAAWAPAEGETLAGGGALMSANLLAEGDRRINRNDGTTYADGVWSIPANGTSREKNAAADWPTGTEAVTENQTLHIGLSVRAASGASVVIVPGVAYVDGAGNLNSAATLVRVSASGTWQRVERSLVMPSGMRVSFFFVHQGAGGAALELTAPCLSYGSPVCLASSAHTPYATQDHVSVTYATKASLKVTDDSVKAEVSARAQTDRNVADLSSRLTQTANSLTSEISDRKSAITTVTGLANAAQSTADNAAKQANLYRIGLGDAGAVAKWIHLGTLTSAGDASCAIISVYSGNGYNAQPSQNSKLTITIKDGWQSTSSAVNACGVTVMRENCDNALVDVLAQSARVYDVWVYVPWAHSEGRYSISGDYAAWKHSGATQKAEPATSSTQVKQDVAYRLADATKAQTMALENKSSIKQLSDSITSLVKGESTYTDPDGKSATSGIYSLVTQTRDSVTALFGQYTKTADLASTQAVKDAKKAGTDAQATADAAKSAASAAQGTANGAKSTADSLATMIREDSTGITVGKSADGQTYTTGRTRMTDRAFEVLDKAGKVLASFGGNVVSLLGGILTIAAGQGGGGSIYTADGNSLFLKSGKDAEVSGNRGSYIEVNDAFASLNSKPAGGAMNSLMANNDGIFAQTQGVGGLMLGPVHSLYNPNNGQHVYTGKASEISDLKSNGWKDEGVKFYAFLGIGNR